MKSQNIQTHAGDIAVSEAGAGRRSLLMLHGNSGSKDVFAAQLSDLSDGWRVIAVDLAGHGGSSNARNPERDYTLAGHAAYLAEIVDALALDDVVVLGTSLGGHIALELVALLPSATGLMIVSTPPFAKSLAGLGAAFMPGPALELSGKERLTEADIDAFVQLHRLGDGFDDAGFRRAIARCDGAARTTLVASLLLPEAADQLRLAQNCPVPIAVVAGGDDDLVNLDHIDALRYRDLWRRQVHRIKGAGHAPQMSHPTEFNEIVRAFLEDISASQPGTAQSRSLA